MDINLYGMYTRLWFEKDKNLWLNALLVSGTAGFVGGMVGSIVGFGVQKGGPNHFFGKSRRHITFPRSTRILETLIGDYISGCGNGFAKAWYFGNFGPMDGEIYSNTFGTGGVLGAILGLYAQLLSQGNTYKAIQLSFSIIGSMASANLNF